MRRSHAITMLFLILSLSLIAVASALSYNSFQFRVYSFHLTENFQLKTPNCLTAFAHESDRLRPNFFEAKLYVSPVPLVGQQATMSLEMTAVAGDCESATVQLKAPAGIALLGQSVFTHQSLNKDASRRYSTDIMVMQEGSYALQATVHFQLPDGQQRAEHFFTYLSAGKAYSHVRNDVPFLTTTPGPQIQMLAPPAVTSPATCGTITISGYITYYDDNLSMEVPIRRVAVELLEMNTQSSQKIEKAYTDDDGFYSFENVSNVDPEDGTARDIQLRISFENDALRIANAEDVPHRFEILTIYNAPDGHINGNYILDSRNQHRGLGHIFNCVMDVYDFLLESVNWHRDRITVKWPYGQHPQYESQHYMLSGKVYEEYIQVPAGWEWHRNMLLHEYGHAVMTALYKYNAHILPRSSFQGTHSINTVSDLGFAMEEGWAEFFEALVDDNAYNMTAYANTNAPNIESNDWWTGDADGRGRNTSGEVIEGAVASILWDIADTGHSRDGSPGVDDDGIEGRFAELWDLMLKYRPVDIMWLWNRWIDNSYGQTGALYSIYTDHGVEVAKPPDADEDEALTINNPPQLSSIEDITDEEPPTIITDAAEINEPIGIKGDVDNDGEIKSKDATMTLYIAAGRIKPDDYQIWAADMNGDGEVGSDDAILILRQVSGLSVSGRSAYRQADENSDSQIGIPECSRLMQNFPNPFNPETWIPYQLTRDSDVAIRIYSVTGEMVRELHLGYRPAGIYASRDEAAYWDGRNESGIPVASGLYFYTIRTGDFSATSKMIITR